MRKWLADNKIKKADKDVNSPYLITDDVVNKAKKHFLNEDLKSEVTLAEILDNHETVIKKDDPSIDQMTIFVFIEDKHE